MGRSSIVTALLLTMPAAAALANPQSDALRAEASTHIYNLDHERAIALFRRAVEADPQDAAAYRGLAAGLWLSITFRRGNMTVDDYLGRLSKPTGPTPPAQSESAKAFTDAVERALSIARRRIAVNPQDADAP